MFATVWMKKTGTILLPSLDDILRVPLEPAAPAKQLSLLYQNNPLFHVPEEALKQKEVKA